MLLEFTDAIEAVNLAKEWVEVGDQQSKCQDRDRDIEECVAICRCHGTSIHLVG